MNESIVEYIIYIIKYIMLINVGSYVFMYINFNMAGSAPLTGADWLTD